MIESKETKIYKETKLLETLYKNDRLICYNSDYTVKQYSLYENLGLYDTLNFVLLRYWELKDKK